MTDDRIMQGESDDLFIYSGPGKNIRFSVILVHEVMDGPSSKVT